MSRISFEQTVCLITGASSGLGEEFARQLAPQAKALILVARRKEPMEQLRSDLLRQFPALRVTVCTCDLTRVDDIDRMVQAAVKAHGEIDILINNAGMGDIGFFETSQWPKLEQMLKTNIVGLTYLTRQFVVSMIARRKGGILFVSSSASKQSLPGFGVYSATKYYVSGFADALRAELAPLGIVVSSLCPGPVATEFGRVAAPTTKSTVPKVIEISAASCVRTALRGFACGRAEIIPGFVMNFVLFCRKLAPQFFVRYLLQGLGFYIRMQTRKAGKNPA